MDNYKLTSKDFFKTIQIIHFALITGVIFFAAVTCYLHYSNLAMDYGTEIIVPLFIVVSVFTISGIFASQFIFKQSLRGIVKNSNLKYKLSVYRSALIVKFAIIEGCSFFVVIAYYMTGHLFFLTVSGLLLIVFITYRPTKEKSITDLELSRSEQQLIYDSNAIID